MRFATLAVFYPLLQLEVAGRISGRPLQYPKLAERDLLSLLGLEGSTPSIAGGDILGGVPTLGLGGGQGQGQGQNGVQPAAAGSQATTSFALPMAMSLQSPATVTGNPSLVGSPLFTSGNTIYTSPATPLANGAPSTQIGVVSQSSLRFDGASSALPTPSAIGSLKGSGSSGSDNANGSTNGSDDYVGSDASTTPPAELTEWKVIGIAVMTITLIGTIVLSVTFFDQWWGFLRAVVCGRRARRKRDAEMFGMGGEEMVPDWNRQSWKFKLDSEYGHRYPDMGTFGSQGGKEKVKEEVLGKGTKKAKADDRESQKKQKTTSTLSPEVFPRL
ncbi:hypothetical protein CVT26_014175 [Gymnopilus dilepis]|uniref:Uncharacterized protein n=1 Tax=Gymnopilus dilepis TaxID=231916 RepID=A0A409VU61_9AGAR|nr:hypothetical protein CVT26_014175 [Gymnopilus dilepis]